MQSSSHLEITVISGEALRASGRSVTKNSYAVVRTDPFNARTTRVDRDGGSHPHWNEKLDLPFPVADLFITVEVHCKTGSRDTTLAAARVPVSDVMADFVPPYLLHFLSYRLREPGGGRNGIINLAVRLVQSPRFVQYPPASVTKQVPGVAPNREEKHSGDGVVIGLPISYGRY